MKTRRLRRAAVQAGADIAGLVLPQSLALGGQPLLGLGQTCPGQKRTPVALGALPLGLGLAQAVLPEAEGAVLPQPVPQGLPVLEQGLVDELDGVLVAGRVVAGDHQAGVGEARDQGPVLRAHLSAGGDLAGVGDALAGAHHLDQDVADPLTLWFGEGRIDGISMAGKGALEAAQFLVGQVGEAPLALVLPELSQGEFQERQAGAAAGGRGAGGFVPGELAGQLGEVAQDALGQQVLELDPGALGRCADDGAQALGVGHGAEQLLGMAVEASRQPFVIQGVAEEVSAQGEQEAQGRGFATGLGRGLPPRR